MSRKKNRWKNKELMAYITYIKLWETEFYNNVFKKNKCEM